MATYLNAGIKKQIRNMVIQKVLRPQMDYLKLLEYELGESAYKILYEKWEMLFLALPDHIAPVQNYITFIVIENGNRKRQGMDLKANKKFVSMRFDLMEHPEITDKRFLDDLEAFDKFRRKIANEKVNWKLSIDAILHRTKTFEALYRKWPEVREIAKEFEPAQIAFKEEKPDPQAMNQINAQLAGKAAKNENVQ